MNIIVFKIQYSYLAISVVLILLYYILVMLFLGRVLLNNILEIMIGHSFLGLGLWFISNKFWIPTISEDYSTVTSELALFPPNSLVLVLILRIVFSYSLVANSYSRLIQVFSIFSILNIFRSSINWMFVSMSKKQ